MNERDYDIKLKNLVFAMLLEMISVEEFIEHYCEMEETKWAQYHSKPMK